MEYNGSDTTVTQSITSQTVFELWKNGYCNFVSSVVICSKSIARFHKSLSNGKFYEMIHELYENKENMSLYPAQFLLIGLHRLALGYHQLQRWPIPGVYIFGTIGLGKS